ncbi:hypothetical protein ACWGKK_40470 [Streptomyces chartreusis]|uniref:hypothetical protein n=1 Tax=Streptomyces TaxID=1883 RepID=UPI000897DBF3|nr:hypothetical protein [Streptomyces sp. PAN_FS17]SEE09501.1 hypothetical protein SAMN05216482_9159 [Streptomyces sp. PAN_FS17]
MHHENEDTRAEPAQRQPSPRFSKLPDRVRPEDMVEERPATPHDSAGGAYNPDWWLIRMGGL